MNTKKKDLEGANLILQNSVKRKIFKGTSEQELKTIVSKLSQTRSVFEIRLLVPEVLRRNPPDNLDLNGVSSNSNYSAGSRPSPCEFALGLNIETWLFVPFR